MEMTHFMRLARVGKYRGASTGERSARQLAHAMQRCVPGLDDLAIAGAIEWLKLCQRRPTFTQDFLDGIISREVTAFVEKNSDDQRTDAPRTDAPPPTPTACGPAAKAREGEAL